MPISPPLTFYIIQGPINDIGQPIDNVPSLLELISSKAPPASKQERQDTSSPPPFFPQKLQQGDNRYVFVAPTPQWGATTNYSVNGRQQH